MLDHQQLFKNKQEVTAGYDDFSIFKTLQANLVSFPDKEALIFVDPADGVLEKLTYREFTKQVLSLAQFLKEKHGLGKGDTIALNLGNTPEILLFHLACWLIGCITVPLDLKRDDADRKKYKLELADCRAVVVGVDSTEVAFFEQIKPGIKVLRMSREIRQEIALGEQLSLTQSDSSNIGLILFTSGTTYLPKGVQLSVSNLLLNADGIKEWLEITAKDHFHIVLPLHHINSTTMSLATLLAGGTIVLSTRYSKSNFWKVMAENNCSLSSIVPTICFDLLSEEQSFSDYRESLQQVSRIQIGSAPVKPTDTLKFYHQYGIKLVQGYGSTETALRVTGVEWVGLADEQYQQLLLSNSIGSERKWNNVEVLKTDGSVADEKEVGEICIRGPILTKGYLANKKANKESFINGWFHSGDVGYWQNVSGNKNIFLNGRIKEIIIKGGVNVSPLLIEHAVLKNYPDISTCFVAAIPDERYGEEIGVAVAFDDSVPVEKRIKVMETLKSDADRGKIKGVAEYESPKYVFEVPLTSLPKTSTGKIQRVKIKQYFQDMFTPIAETSSHIFKKITPFDVEEIDDLVRIHNTRWGKDLGMDIETASAASESGIVIGAINKETGKLVGSAFGERFYSHDVENKVSWLRTYAGATGNLMLKPSTTDGDAVMFVTISTDGRPFEPSMEKDSAKYQKLLSEAPQLIEEYLVEKVDPVLNFHMRPKAGMKKGASVLYPLENARPSDVEALGYSVMMKYPSLPEGVVVNEDSSLGAQILEAGFIYTVKNGLKKAYAYSRPSGFLSWVRK